jgi:hypothetical protein
MRQGWGVIGARAGLVYMRERPAMTHTKDEALKLAAEFDKRFTSMNGVDVPERVSVPRDEWRALHTAIKQPLAAPTVQEPIYQMQMMDGKWIDQAKQSYEYNKAHGHTVRIVYTTPPAGGKK